VTFSGINDGRTTTHPAIRYPAYRELANKLRGIADQSSVPEARQKILNLASLYEVRANQLDMRSPPEDFSQDPC
jgi:hypothetical protein